MADTRPSSTGVGASMPRQASRTAPQPTGWVGWIIFAAVMLLIAGTLNLISGIVALVNDDWVVWSNEGNLYLDLTSWGWVHFGVGVALVLAGLGLLTGNMLARAVAVFMAGAGMIANFLFIPAFPLWAITLIAINGFVISAITAHGREMRPYY